MRACERCGAEYESSDPRRKYCDDCKNGHDNKRDAKRATARAIMICTRCGNPNPSENIRNSLCDDCRLEDRPFAGVDGEGFTVDCMVKGCDCKLYTPVNPENPTSPCECGHQKSARRVPHKDVILFGHRHVYQHLRCGDYTLERTEGIYIGEALSFLYDTAREYSENTAFVIYSGSYDFTMLFSTLPEERAARLLLPEEARKRKRTKGAGSKARPLPVDFRDRRTNEEWEIDWMNRGRFRLRPKDITKRIGYNPETGKMSDKRSGWRYICDVFPFWQCSFLKAIDPANYPPGEGPCSSGDYELIKKGKERRSHAVLDDETRSYCELEVHTLERLLLVFNRALIRHLGIRLGKDQWFGPGQLANKMLRKFKAHTRLELEQHYSEMPNGGRIAKALKDSYYGGWFEIMMHGIAEETLFLADMPMFRLGLTFWGYDINSAYPYIISRLPCLMHGKWSSGHGPRKTLPKLAAGDYRIVYACVKGSDPYIGTMLHRIIMSHLIVRPHATEGWYWQRELEAAQHAGLIDSIEVFDWHTYRPCNCPPPCREIAGYYKARQELPDIITDHGKIKGKDTPAGVALKLGYNSVYGKLAQSIGDEPPFQNWMWASLITSGCRTMILDAIATHPQKSKAVAMVATDAVIFSSRHPSLPLSKELGEWDESSVYAEDLFKPGTYWSEKVRRSIRDGKQPVFKSRGANARAMSTALADADEQFRNWHPPMSWPSVEFPYEFEIVNCIQALRWGKYPGEGIVERTPFPDKERRSQWWKAGLVFEGNIHRQSSDPHMKRQVCSKCRCPDDYEFDAHEHDMNAVYRDGNVWRTRVYEAGHLGSGKACASIPYDGQKMSLRALMEKGLTTDAGADPDGYSLDLIMESLEMG
jgi:hypothetical protein